jgi:hypothetical protein
MNRSKVSDYIAENFLADIKRFGVNSMYVGEKVTNGEATGSLAIVYAVAHKIKATNLHPEKLIPNTINLDGMNIDTDVVEQDIEYEFESDLCHNINDTGDRAIIMKNRELPRTTVDQDQRSYDIVRYPGMSIMNLSHSLEYKHTHGIENRDNPGYIYKGIQLGTLGIFARDDQDGRLVGLSNNHVLTPGFVTADKQSNKSINYKEHIVVSPGDDQNIEGTSISTGYMTRLGNTKLDGIEYKIGEVKRSWPLQTLGNEIDAAICSVTLDHGTTGEKAITNDSHTPVGMNISYSMEWATTDEIDELVLGIHGNALFKTGYATGAVGHPVADTSKTCALYTGGTGFVGFVSGKQFKNIIQYKAKNGVDPSAGGDSGSPLCAFISNTWKLIGIHFAGGRDRNTGEHHALACRIDKIAEILKISRWVGTNTEISDVDNYSTITKPKYAIVAGWSGQATIKIDGKTYYQTGRTGENITHRIDSNTGDGIPV